MNQYITGAMIRRLREEQKISQNQLAVVLGVSDKAVSRWETGRGYPDITLIEPLAKAMGRPELAVDPKFATNEARLQNVDEIEAIVEEWTCTRTNEEIRTAMDAYSIPSVPVADAAALLENPQIQARGVIEYIQQANGVGIPINGQTIHFSETPEVRPVKAVTVENPGSIRAV